MLNKLQITYLLINVEGYVIFFVVIFFIDLGESPQVVTRLEFFTKSKIWEKGVQGTPPRVQILFSKDLKTKKSIVSL